MSDSTPNWPTGYNPSAAEWNALWAAKADADAAVITNPAITGGTIAGAAISGGTITGLTAPLPSASGGTGVNNGTSVISLGGNYTTSGAFPLTFNLTGATTITLPTSGTFLSDTLANGDIWLGNASNVATPTSIATYLASPAAIGGTAPAAGAFTTLAASSTVSGTGFSTYLASPPAIGGTAPAAGSFTSLTGALQNYLSGFQHSAPGGATTQTFTSGAASDSTNAIYMPVASTYTKTTASWAVGSGNGMLDTGATGGAASTWYYTYVIIRPDTGVTDFLMSLSASAPTLPANYTKFRRIGAIKLDGSKNILGHFQTGDRFDWTVPINEYNSTPGVTTAVTLTLVAVPTAISVVGLFSGNVFDATTGNSSFYLSSLSQTDNAAATPFLTGQTGALSTGDVWSKMVVTNTSGQVRRRVSSTTTIVSIDTGGWIDNRGKDF